MADWPPLHDYSRSRAVLMGTWDYAFLDPVPAAENSLRRMTGLLSGPLCGWPRDRLLLVENEHSPGDLPDRLITAFDGARDVALFYFVGHGQIAPDDQLCLGLARSRSDPNRRASTSLRFSDVRQALNDSGAATKIVILDCCFAGLATAGTLAGLTGDLLDLTAGTGAYTLAATSAYATAWYEVGPGLARPQTYFTKYLADLIEGGAPGQPPRLRLDVLYHLLRDSLAADQRPVPSRRAVDDAREFVFSYNAAPPQTHRDPEQELTQLHARLIQSEGLRAEASTQIRALQAKADELAGDLARLQDLEVATQPRSAAQERQLQEAIGEAAQQLADTQAEQAAIAFPQESAESRSVPQRAEPAWQHRSSGPAIQAAGPQSEETATDEGMTAPSVSPAKTAGAGERALQTQAPEYAEEAENTKAPAPGTSHTTQEDGVLQSAISTTQRPLHAAVAAELAVRGDDSHRGMPPAPSIKAKPVTGNDRVRHVWLRRRPLQVAASATVAAISVAVIAYSLSGSTPTVPPNHQPRTGTDSSSPSVAQSAISAGKPTTKIASAVAQDGSIPAPSGFRFEGMGISPNGAVIAAIGSNANATIGNLYVWQLANLQSQPLVLNAPAGGNIPGGMSFDPKNANDIAVADYKGVDLWNLADRQDVTILFQEIVANANGVAYSADGGTLAVAGNGGVNLLNVRTHAWGTWSVDDPANPAAEAEMQDVAISPTGTALAATDNQGRSFEWNLATRVLIGGSFTHVAAAPAFSPNGELLAVGAQGGTKLLNPATGTEVGSPLAGTDTSPIGEAFSPDSGTLAVLDGNRALYLWNLASRRSIKITCPASAIIGATLAFSPDGKTLAVVGEFDSTIYLFKVTYSNAS